MPLQLVHSPSPPDLRRFADDLAAGTDSGEIIGLGVVVMLKGRRFFVDCFGQMARNPYECVGLVGELEHCLQTLGRKRRNTDTTT